MEEVFACNDISTDEDYPENMDNLVQEWMKGKMNNLKIGDRVKLQYLMNTDGIYNPRRFQNQIGTVIKMDITEEFQTHKGKRLAIGWDNQDLNKSYYPWMPYQFIKLK